MLAVGHLKHTRHTKQDLLSVSIADNLDTEREREREREESKRERGKTLFFKVRR